MKEFNLEEAINGKAFYLKNGYRGVIKYCVDDILTSEDRTPRFAYIGYVLDNRGFLNLSKAAWDENGITNEPRSYDAVGMVEDMLEQNTEEKMKMKPFDLKAALNGEPVMLRNGNKAIILNDARNYFKDIRLNKEVLIGFISDVNNQDKFLYHGAWTSDGSWVSNSVDEFDIIGMWKDPKISIDDLPKPFKPQETESYYYINGGCIGYRNEYRYSNLFDRYAAENGNCFSTRECAEMWLKLMKGMLE